MTSRSLHAVQRADEVRSAAFRVAVAVRQIENLAKTDTVSAKSWADLRWALDRLTVLVARYKPADPEPDPQIGGAPTRAST
ncbi:hypothetical protein [Micromonospora fulviviridis]|uniref:Uncharacterized protein n=1 Tax=Micromonospora fulviviridis TaxID=47860 RepID=A0ABV2VGY7_9ACTN